MKNAKKLTAAQERAKEKLTYVWQSPYELRESIPTLASLTRRGIAEVRYDLPGSIAFPRVSCWYKLRK